MSTKPNDYGQTNRINPQEAYAIVGGTRLINFGAISHTIDDPSSKEKTTDGNGLWVDEFLDVEGEFGLFPVSNSIPAIEQMVENRQIMQILYRYPDDDPRGTRSFVGCRITSLDNEGMEQGENYMITGSWEGFAPV